MNGLMTAFQVPSESCSLIHHAIVLLNSVQGNRALIVCFSAVCRMQVFFFAQWPGKCQAELKVRTLRFLPFLCWPQVDPREILAMWNVNFEHWKPAGHDELRSMLPLLSACLDPVGSELCINLFFLISETAHTGTMFLSLGFQTVFV